MKHIINYTLYVLLFIIINLAYLIWEFKLYNSSFKKFIDTITEVDEDYDPYDIHYF